MKNIELSDWGYTEPKEMTESDLNRIDTEINRDSVKIGVSHTRDGRAKLCRKKYVGVSSLPSGRIVEIKPKAAEGNLLNLLRYASGTDVEIIENQEEFKEGSNFIQAVAQLFLDEMETLLRSGLRKEYVRKESKEKYVRGQINEQKQLQTHGAVVTDFECSFEELSHDNELNQAILYSTAVLARIVQDQVLESELIHFRELLRKKITLRKVEPVELNDIELNRLNEEYKQILQLCETVINSSFVQSMESGNSSSYSFFIDMEKVFEKVVERAFKEIVENQGYNVWPQDKTNNLLRGGNSSVNMFPDIVLKNGENSILVADAKWKTSTENADIYQLVAYELAHETSGLLIYPEQEGEIEDKYTMKTGADLQLLEIPTKKRETFKEWHRELKKNLEEVLRNLDLED